ncbi:unnamed protein product, partial [Ilex paraguariensis]
MNRRSALHAWLPRLVLKKARVKLIFSFMSTTLCCPSADYFQKLKLSPRNQQKIISVSLPIFYLRKFSSLSMSTAPR